MARLRFLSSVLALLIVTSCGGSLGPAIDYEAVATSATTVRVAFSTSVGAGAEEAGSYTVLQEGGTFLEVYSVLRVAPDVVLLSTEEQKANATYELTVQGVQAASSGSIAAASSQFGGSAAKAPVVASAIALDPMHVLVTFGDPGNGQTAEMGDGALDARFYDIRVVGAAGGGSADELAVVDGGIVFADTGSGGLDRSRVVLETEPMADAQYRVKVTNVVTRAGDKLVDPYASTAEFQGIPVEDDISPVVDRAVAVSNTEVLVDFREPVLRADSPDRYTITYAGGQLAVTGAAYTSVYKTQVRLTTAPQRDEETIYTVTVNGVTDFQENEIQAADASAQFAGISSLGPIDGDTEPPRIRGAVSTSNTHVTVVFSEPVTEESAGNPDHYSITSSALDGVLGTQAVLKVVGAQRDSADPSKVRLTTMQQSEIRYTLAVAGVTDLAGNQVAPKDRDNPYDMEFLGTGASGPALDSDCDGLSDAAEQAGWIVSVTDENGATSRKEVTSDPGTPGLDPSCEEDASVNAASRDTDADGMSDKEELVYGINPRSPDTDGDDLSDYRELTWIYSEPTEKDTDGDGLPDGLEFNFFGTSPINPDSDGDQFPDDVEATSDNRDPLVADIPRVQITVGDVDLTLDERYSYTDTEGTAQEVSTSSSTTLEQGTERVYSTSDTTTLANSLTFGQSVTGTYSFPKDFGVEVGVSSEQSQSEEYTSSVSQESARRSSETYNEAVERTSSFQSSSEVTREIVDASIRLALDLGGVSDVAFSVTNLEVTALWQDPIEPTRLVPVGTLVPSTQLQGGGAPTYNLGPFVPTIGPLVFENRDVFPRTVEQLMRAPRGLVFKVANYDITDENGRNFAFTSQETYDRTAGIVIDYGNGDVRRSRISTIAGRVAPYADTNGDGRIDAAIDCFDAAPGVFDDDNRDGLDDDSCDNDRDGIVDDPDRIVFDETGATTGTTMRDALASLGISYTVADVDYDSVSGLEVVTSVDGLANGEGGSDDNAWVLFVSREVGGGFVGSEPLGETDFEDIVLHAGETYTLAFLQDKDEDQLFNREEFLHGSSDDWTNSDDGTGSNDETCPTGEGYPFSYFQDHPGETLPLDDPGYTCDTITDYDEVRVGWVVRVRGETEYRAYSSPRRPDSDADRLADHVEQMLGTDPRRRDTDEDGLSDFDEVYGFRIRFRGDLSFTDFTDKYCLAATGGGCTTSADWVTDPLDPDTDGDGIEDGFELRFGANPQEDDAADFIDTDQDGLPDAVEEFGFEITVNGATVTAFSSKYEPDTDGDGLPDLLEHRIGSDPQRANTDGDAAGLSDYNELDISTFSERIDSSFDLNEFQTVCGNGTYNAGRCSYDPSASSQYGTDPSEEDTDGDDLLDSDELFEEWTVQVTGGAPYTVQSDPTDANSDNDSWNDGEEVNTHGTDPTLGDTDGDGALDSDEGTLCVGSDCRDPLTPDQRIRVTFNEIEWFDDAEPASAEPGDFYWTFSVILPSGSSTEVDSDGYFPVDDDDGDDGWNLNTPYPVDASTSFIKDFSETFSIDVNFGEDDAAGTGDDDCVLDETKPFSGQVSPSNPTFSPSCAAIRTTVEVF